MEYLSQYIVLLAQRKDLDNWVNILVVVMLAIFWLVGGLIKTMGKKAHDRQQPGTESQPKSPRRPEYLRQALSRKPPPVPSAGHLPSQPKPRIQPEGAARPRPASYKPDDSMKKPAHIPAVNLVVHPEHPQPLFAATSLSFLDISNPQELRKAIVYYEIIGKPISIRGPHLPPW